MKRPTLRLTFQAAYYTVLLWRDQLWD